MSAPASKPASRIGSPTSASLARHRSAFAEGDFLRELAALNAKLDKTRRTDRGPFAARALWNPFLECPLVRGAMRGTIAMRLEYLAAIAIVAFAVGTGLAIHSVGSPHGKRSTPDAAQLATRLAESVDPLLLRSGG